MTNRLTFGIDPGQTGAIAVLADGVPVGFIDMPTYARKAGGNEVDPFVLAARIRGVVMKHPGAYVHAVLEQVNAMPSIKGPDGKRRDMGASSGFRFGESFGTIKGVMGALGIAWIAIEPAKWKKLLGLTGCEKDVARTYAIQRYPMVAEQLCRKKDIGRADALLIATWSELTERVAHRPAA